MSLPKTASGNDENSELQRFLSGGWRLSRVRYVCDSGDTTSPSYDRVNCYTDCWLTADGKVWVSGGCKAVEQYRLTQYEEITAENGPELCGGQRLVCLHARSAGNYSTALSVKVYAPYGKGDWVSGKWSGRQRPLACGDGSRGFGGLIAKKEAIERRWRRSAWSRFLDALRTISKRGELLFDQQSAWGSQETLI